MTSKVNVLAGSHADNFLEAQGHLLHESQIFLAKRITCATIIASLISGCSTMVAYSPQTSGPNQSLRYTQGVGTLSVKDSDQEIFMYPTFRMQEMKGPTFTIGYANNTDAPVNFSTENIKAYFRGELVQVYTYTEKIAEIQSEKRGKQVLLAIAGGLAAGAAAYSASRQTYTNNYSGYVQSRGRVTAFAGSNTVRVYDPMSGILVGAAVGGATGLGIQQLEYNAQNQEQSAGSILQENTIDSRQMVVGNLILKDCCDPFSKPNETIRFEVTVNGKVSVFEFARITGGKVSPISSVSAGEQSVANTGDTNNSKVISSDVPSSIGKSFKLRYEPVALYREPRQGAERLLVLNKSSGGVVKEVNGDWVLVEVGDPNSPLKRIDGWIIRNMVDGGI